MAGISSRLRPLTNDCHKVLLKIGQKSLVEHQLEAFNQEGVKEVIFVLGYKADLIKSKIGDHYGDIKIKYIYNQYYLTRNINYSLYLAREDVIGEDFIYMEGDLFFHHQILKMIINSCFDNCLIVDPNFKSDKVDTLVLGNNNRIYRLLFENHGDLRGIMEDYNDIIGEPIFLIKFNSKTSRLLFNRLAKSNFEGGPTLYNIFEKCFTLEPMNYIITEGYPWIEIDNHEDLKKANDYQDKILSQSESSKLNL